MTSRVDRVNRHPERARHDRQDLYDVLDAGLHVGTLSTIVDARPWVVPMLYARVGDEILLHGSTGAGALRHVANGATAALSVMLVDGWVYAHTLFDSSANYRSAVVHGRLIALEGSDAVAALDALSETIMPGRSNEVPRHTKKQLNATQALALRITDGRWTVKVRDQEPSAPQPEDGVAPNVWTGTIPIRTVYSDPVTSSYLPPEMPIAKSALAYKNSSKH